MKKYMSLFLAMLMLATLFVGCTGKTAETAPAANAPQEEAKTSALPIAELSPESMKIGRAHV